MENIDDEMVLSPEKIVLPNQSDCMNSDDAFDNEFSASVMEQQREKEEVPVVSRKRGRPRGSCNRISNPSSGNFTPYVVTIQRGKDIVEKVMSFIQIGVQAICILAASGPISVVNLRHARSDQNVIRYEGYFEILTLKGSHVDVRGVPNDKLALSIGLAYPDGRVFGGAVCGCLIAAAPVQLVLGIIKQSEKKRKSKKRFIERPTPAVMTGNINSPIAPIPGSVYPEDTITSPQGSTMSPTLVDEAIEDDKHKDHNAYMQRSDKNASKSSDQSSDHHVPVKGSHPNSLQPLDQELSETLSEDDKEGSEKS